MQRRNGLGRAPRRARVALRVERALRVAGWLAILATPLTAAALVAVDPPFLPGPTPVRYVLACWLLATAVPVIWCFALLLLDAAIRRRKPAYRLLIDLDAAVPRWRSEPPTA